MNKSNNFDFEHFNCEATKGCMQVNQLTEKWASF